MKSQATFMIIGALIGAALTAVFFGEKSWWLSGGVIGVGIGQFLHMYISKKDNNAND